jgi:hypothetical protein
MNFILSYFVMYPQTILSFFDFPYVKKSYNAPDDVVLKPSENNSPYSISSSYNDTPLWNYYTHCQAVFLNPSPASLILHQTENNETHSEAITQAQFSDNSNPI